MSFRDSTLLAVLAVIVVAAPGRGAEGDELWEHTYGGGAQDWGYDMKVTGDGGFILTGYTKSFGMGGSDVYLVKLDAAGGQQWATPLGSAANDVGEAVIQTGDGGFLIAGNRNIGSTTTKDGLLIRTDAAGQELWQHTYGGSGEDELAEVVECASGGYAMAGFTSSFGGGHLGWIVRVDTAGAVQWQQTVVLAGHGADYLTGLVETAGGDFVASGYSGDGSTFPEYNAKMAKVDSGGTQQWVRTFDHSNYDRAYDIALAPTGGFAMAGPSLGAMTIWRTDAGGGVQWIQRFNTVTGDFADAVWPTSDGGFLVAGDTWNYDNGGYQLYAGKTDGAGNPLWERLYGGAGAEICRAIAETPAGDYAFAGSTGSGASDDLLLLLVEGPGVPTDADEAVAGSASGLSLAAYPNPFASSTRIAFALPFAGSARAVVVDARGRHVRTLLESAFLPAGRSAVTWDGRDDSGRRVAAGVYFARVRAAGDGDTEKLVILR